eukprot:g32398.t1
MSSFGLPMEVLETQLQEFGRMPRQLFFEAHPPRLRTPKWPPKKLQEDADQSEPWYKAVRQIARADRGYGSNGPRPDGSASSSWRGLGTGHLAVKPLATPTSFTGITAVDCCAQNLYAVGEDGCLRVCSLQMAAESSTARRNFRISPMPLSALAVIETELLALGGHDNAVSLYSTSCGSSLSRSSMHADTVTCLGAARCKSDGIVSGSRDQSVVTWAVTPSGLKSEVIFDDLQQPVLSCACSGSLVLATAADQQLISSASGCTYAAALDNAGELRLWDLRQCSESLRLQTTASSPAGLAARLQHPRRGTRPWWSGTFSNNERSTPGFWTTLDDRYPGLHTACPVKGAASVLASSQSLAAIGEKMCPCFVPAHLVVSTPLPRVPLVRPAPDATPTRGKEMCKSRGRRGGGVSAFNSERERTKVKVKTKGRRKLHVPLTWARRSASSRLFAVLRHGERADILGAHVNGETWSMLEESKEFPIDPPLSDHGRHEASRVANTVKAFAERNGGQLHVVVSSVYMRCVQTAIEVCKKLGPSTKLLLDHSLGEVFGHCVLGDQKPSSTWRSSEHLIGYARSQGIRIVKKVCGPKPVWPETLRMARMRYAAAFLGYLRRSEICRRNFVLVSHADCIASVLALIPSKAGRMVESVSTAASVFGSLVHTRSRTTIFAIATLDSSRERPGWVVELDRIQMGPRWLGGEAAARAAKRAIEAIHGHEELDRRTFDELLGGLSQEPLGDITPKGTKRQDPSVAGEEAWNLPSEHCETASFCSSSTFLFGASETGSECEITPTSPHDFDFEVKPHSFCVAEASQWSSERKEDDLLRRNRFNTVGTCSSSSTVAAIIGSPRSNSLGRVKLQGRNNSAIMARTISARWSHSDGDRLPDLASLLVEGATSSVTLCASSAVLLGVLLLVAAALLMCIHLAWSAFAADIAAFYQEAAANAPGDISTGATEQKTH